MHNSYEMLGEYSDNLDTDFSNWENFFSKNSQFSDAENDFHSSNLIKSLQSSTNKNSAQIDGTVCRNEIVRRGVVKTLSCKELKSSKFGKINASGNYIPQRELKQEQKHHFTENIPQNSTKTAVILNQKTNKQSPRKNVHENSDSEDFCIPNKKCKRSKTSTKNIFSNSGSSIKRNFDIYSSKASGHCLESMKGIQHLKASQSQNDIKATSNPESFGKQNVTVSSLESCSNKKVTSSQEISTSQKIHLSSQETPSSQKMSTSSQEISTSQKMSTSSQEISTSQKMSTSSQETPSNKKMSTSRKDISTCQRMSTSSQDISTCQEKITPSRENSCSQNILSCSEFCCSSKTITSSQESLGKRVMAISIEENFSHSTSETHVIITPHSKKSNHQNSGILNQGIVNSKILNTYNHHISDNSKVSREKMKIDFSVKNDFAETFTSSISDSFCNKTGRCYNKSDKRMIWSLRKRELDVTKRENAVEIREKLLDSREAKIQKREQILQAREKRYLRLKKTSFKNLTKKSIIVSKISEEKTRCLRR